MNRIFGFQSKYVHYGSDGMVLWESDWLDNALMDEGERNFIDSYLRNQNHPSSFFVRLFADMPVETDSLASLANEPGGLVGYAAQQVLRSANAAGWPTLQQDGGDFQAVSKTVSFNAIDPYPAVTHAVLATSSDNTGLLIDATALSQTRQLRSGERLDVIFKPKLS